MIKVKNIVFILIGCAIIGGMTWKVGVKEFYTTLTEANLQAI